MILMTMVLNLLPDRKYEKYMRLFAGMVFLLLLVQPFAGLTGIEQQMEEAFARLTLQNEAKMLQKEIEDLDDERMQKLTQLYKEAGAYGVEEGDTAIILEDE